MVEDCEKKRLWDRWLCRLGHALIDLGDNTYALKGQILAKDSVSGELVELEVVDGKLQIAPNVDVEVNLSENIGLLDSDENEINPATEGKQDDIITALGLVAPAGSITSGRKTITTHNVPEQITASSTPIKSVTIQALPGNVGSIAIGSSNAVRASAAGDMNGIMLEAGDAYPVDVDNLNEVWLDASVDGEGVTYMYHV